MSPDEARKIVRDIRRQIWLQEQGKTEKDVNRDEIGEYVCDHWRRDDGIVECVSQKYLPNHIL